MISGELKGSVGGTSISMMDVDGGRGRVVFWRVLRPPLRTVLWGNAADSLSKGAP